jgi:hypothetical protein
MRFAKILRFGGRRLDIGVDLNNLLNTNYTTTFENTYQYTAANTGLGGTWNNPTAIIAPRFVRWNPDRRTSRGRTIASQHGRQRSGDRAPRIRRDLLRTPRDEAVQA